MRKGFTLIELLVVIAIIAILAAILFPVFARARDAARTSKCLAHGRQVGQACLMYMDDNSGRFPSGLTEAVAAALPTWNYTWFTNTGVGEGRRSAERYYYLKKYVKNNDIWICPSAGTNYSLRYKLVYHTNWCSRASDPFVDGDRGFLQQYDSNNDGAIGGQDAYRGSTMAEVQAADALTTNRDRNSVLIKPRSMPPSKKIMWMCYSLGEGMQGIVGDNQYYQFPSFQHGNGTTYVYADGHAAWQRMGKGWAPVGYTSSPFDVVSRGRQ